MHTLVAASLAALSLNPPVMPGEATAVRPAARAPGARAGKVAGQAVAGAGIGLAAGVAMAIPTFAIALCESDCGNDGLFPVLLIATPLAFAAGEATGVYVVGKAVDKESHGSFGRTLLGAVLGTGAGLAVWQGVGEGGTAASFASGVAVSTAATIVAYQLSRPKPGAGRAPRVSVTPTVTAGRAGHGAGGGLRLGVSF